MNYINKKKRNILISHQDIKKIQDTYLTIYNDNEIRNIYNQTNYLEENEYKGYAHHDFTHVCNVKDLSEKILKDLNCEQYIIEETKIAAILHDIGAVQGKKDHAIRSWEFAEKYFLEKNIVLRDKDLVLDAIKNHSDGFDTDNVIRLALILADKLDVKSTRITKLGGTIEGNRQFGNIDDIKICIENAILKISFITNQQFDKKELEKYYFMKKIGKAIKSFAEKFNLKYLVYLNEKVWSEIL